MLIPDIIRRENSIFGFLGRLGGGVAGRSKTDGPGGPGIGFGGARVGSGRSGLITNL